MRRNLVLLIVLCITLIVIAAPALAQDTAVASVNTAYLNVRSGPGLGYGAIATLPRGFGVLLLGRNAEYNWVLIGTTDGVQGWVNINYLYTTTSVNGLPIAESPAGAPIPGTPINPAATISGYVVAQLLSGPNEANPVVASAPVGTNVSLIGRNFDSSWVLIRLANGVQGWIPANGVTSTVPVRALSTADGSVWAPPPPSNPGTPGTGYQTYVIQRGDTLMAIATQFGVNVYTLAQLNGIYNINVIYWGTTLLIPN